MKTAIHLKNWRSDVLSGVIVALVSIPISMGYAQIAGLPPVYGLYGSLLPILVFALLTSSPQFVVGVDAMPAVMVGNALTGMGLVLGSSEAVSLVPVISLLTGAWFILFWLFRAGNVVKYISTPVMGGFISGVGLTIILMQIPKLFGGDPGTGELPALLRHLALQAPSFHLLSALLGFGTVILILLSKKLMPKLPMAVILMLLGGLLTAVFRLDRFGVRLLPSVKRGLPGFILPDLRLMAGRVTDLILLSLTIALVVMAQTLLASNNYARKYGDRLDTRRELLAYAAAEIAGSVVGCCPVNGSVSRSGIADQFGSRSQLMSLTASAVMLLVLLFGTDLLRFLPVPILTGIVIAALIGTLELKLAKRLWKSSKRELLIFLTALLGVLLFGTIYGVVIGVVLSFFSVAVGAVIPPKAFLGQIPGHEGFYDLRRNRSARPIEGTLIYRFSGNLFFANIGGFRQDIEEAVTAETRQVIVEASGIGSIDMTAAEQLTALEHSLRQRGVRLYLTGHVGALNDQLRRLGASSLIESGAVRRTAALALRDAGLEEPYPLTEGGKGGLPQRDESESYAEFEWLYGDHAEEKLEHLAGEIAHEFARQPGLTLAEAEKRTSWGRVGLFDEELLLDYVEVNLEEMAEEGELESGKLDALEEQVEHMRPVLDEAMTQLPEGTQAYISEHNEELRKRLARQHPAEYRHLVQHRNELHGHPEGQKPD